MNKNRFVWLATAFSVVALGVAAFGAPMLGIDAIAFAQSDSSTSVDVTSGGASVEQVLNAIAGSAGDGLDKAAFVNLTTSTATEVPATDDSATVASPGLSTARQGEQVNLTGVPVCYGPIPGQCTGLIFVGDYKIVASFDGGIIVDLAGQLRVAFV